MTVTDRAEVREHLLRLVSGLERLDLDTELTQRRDRVVRLVNDFLLPRLDEPGRPLDVVFVGPTGSGKSTLVNSLGRRQISATGVLRPTTSQPVALVAENRSNGFEDLYGVQCEVVEGDAPILGLMTFIDTPDIDSTAAEHAVIAEKLVDNADVAVLVLSATRYSDHLPWQLLRRAVARGATVVPVLNRVSARSVVAVTDLERRLRAEGLDIDVIAVGEHAAPLGRQRLPALSVHTLARRLASIASRVSDERADIWQRALRLAVMDTEQVLRELRGQNYRILTAQKEKESALRLLAEQLTFDPTLAIGEAPKDSSRSEMRRWSRELRRRYGDTDDLRRHVSGYLLAVVESAFVRHAVAGVDFGSLRASNGWDDLVSAEVDGWLEFSARILDSGVLAPRLPQLAALLAAAMSGEDSSVWAAALGEDNAELVMRARRELNTRLHRIFESMSIDDARDHGHRDPEEVELVLSDLLSPGLPLDA